MKKNIIYGLSANPIHNSHIEIANKLCNYADIVTLMPCYIHNFDKDLIDFRHRKHMCDLAVREAKNPKLYVSAYEKFKKHENCTYLTMEVMKRIFDDQELWIAIGADCANDIRKWLFSDKLIAENNFIVFNRIGYNPDLSWMKPTDILMTESIKEMSSTNLRKLIAQKSPEISNHLNEYVVEYIVEQKFYEGEDQCPNIKSTT
jgi:nicotinate (nicotinamide) nucleotide adenylyltransferase